MCGFGSIINSAASPTLGFRRWTTVWFSRRVERRDAQRIESFSRLPSSTGSISPSLGSLSKCSFRLLHLCRLSVAVFGQIVVYVFLSSRFAVGTVPMDYFVNWPPSALGFASGSIDWNDSIECGSKETQFLQRARLWGSPPESHAGQPHWVVVSRNFWIAAPTDQQDI